MILIQGVSFSIYAEQLNNIPVSSKSDSDNTEVHWKNVPRHPKTQQLLLKSLAEENLFYGVQDTMLDALNERIIDEALRLKNEGVEVKVLDIGAGYGVLSLELAKQGISVYVNDLHEEFLDTMLKEANEQQRKFIHKLPGSVPTILENLNDGGQFDIIVCTRVFPFLSPKEVTETIKGATRLLAPNGHFYAVAITDAVEFLPPEMKAQCEQNGGMLYIDADKFRRLKNGEAKAPPTNTNFLVMSPEALRKQIAESMALTILEHGFLHKVFPKHIQSQTHTLPAMGRSTATVQEQGTEKTTSPNAYVIAEKSNMKVEV